MQYDLIEKIPPITGKLIIWFLVFAMILNGVLTAMKMIRGNVRAQDPAVCTLYDTFPDTQYPDERMESRWPNMIIADK